MAGLSIHFVASLRYTLPILQCSLLPLPNSKHSYQSNSVRLHLVAAASGVCNILDSIWVFAWILELLVCFGFRFISQVDFGFFLLQESDNLVGFWWSFSSFSFIATLYVMELGLFYVFNVLEILNLFWCLFC